MDEKIPAPGWDLGAGSGLVLPLDHSPSSTRPPPPRPIGGYRWRRARGLATVSDHVRLYRARRWPRGDYGVPMPEDLLRAAR
jgi:hypothetical protein